MPASVDIIIVGAGIVGAATALRLARAGYEVAVLDRAEPNSAGSGTTAGNLHIQTIHTRRPGQGIAVDVRRLLPLQRAAGELWNALAEEVSGDLGLVRCGGFMVAETPEQVAMLHAKHEWERAAGIPTEVLDGDTARSVLPLLGPTVRAATWCAWDGYAEPHLAGPALLREAVAAGAALHSNTRVVSIDRIGDTWSVASPDETWNAPVVLDVAGPWMPNIAALAGVALDLRPVSLQMHCLAAEPGTLRVLVQHVGEGVSIKQDRRNRVVLGGGWPAGPFLPEEPAAVLRESIDGNIAQASRLLPALASAPLTDVWTGPVITTPDEMPVVGAVDDAPGMFVAGGTYSFTFAPVWADVLTALISGEQPRVDISPFTPARLATVSRTYP